jgi:hypothetical protein
LPLDFDGIGDSIYHPFDKAGHRHMEYLLHRGSFDEVPLDAICADFAQHYPELLVPAEPALAHSFEADVRRESAGVAAGEPSDASADAVLRPARPARRPPSC